MPPLAAAAVSYAVSAAVTSALTAAIGATLASIVGAIAGKLVSGVMSSMMGKPSRNMGMSAGAAAPYSPVLRDRVTMVRNSVEPHRIVYGTAKVSGALVFAGSHGSSSQYLHLVIVLASHEVEEIGTIYANDLAIAASDIHATTGMVTTGRFKNRMRIRKHLGGVDQVADSDLVAEMGAQWTSAHRLRGRAYIYVRCEWDYDTYPTSYPNFSAIVKGRKDILDPRDDSVGWTDNWALCVRDYVAGAHGIGASADEIDEASFIAAANIADEDVLLDPGTQKRYTCDGVIFTDKKPADIVEDLLTAGAGALVYRQGQYVLYAGAYRTPVVALDEDDLRGPLKVKPRLDRQELFNSVRGTYVDGTAWAAKDFPPVENALYVEQDGGEEIARDIDLPFTTDAVRAQRIAKIILERSRQGVTVELPCKLTALQVAVCEPVTLTVDRLGWSSKVFMPTGWAWNPDGGIDLELQEEAAAVYDWDSGDATTYDAAPDTNLPNPFTVAPPTGLAAVETLAAAADGTARNRVTLTWVAPDDALVVLYEIAFKRSTTDAWTAATATLGEEAEIWDLEPGAYTFRVRALNSLGVRSAWAELAFVVQAMNAPLADVLNLTTLVQGGLVYLSWSAVIDVRPVAYEVRRGPTWSVAEVLGTTATRLWPVTGAGTYWVSANSGNAYSAAPADVVISGDVIVGNLFASYDEQDLGWPGTREGFSITSVDGEAALTLSRNLRDSPDIRAETNIRNAGTATTEGTYTAPAEHRVDQGTARTSTVQFSYTAYGSTDFRSLADIRAFSDIRSAASGAIAAYPEIRLNLGDSPDWGDWFPYVAGAYTFKEIDYRLRVETSDPGVRPLVTAMRFAVDVADLVQTGEGEAVAALGTTIAYDTAFTVAPNLQVTLIEAQDGDTLVIENETRFGFDVQIVNGGVGQDRVINWIAQGY